MATTLSIEACSKAIEYSSDTREKLMQNITKLSNSVDTQFSGLKDPSIKRYLELSEQVQTMLKNIGGKMDEVSEHCQHVIAWIKKYTEY